MIDQIENEETQELLTYIRKFLFCQEKKSVLIDDKTIANFKEFIREIKINLIQKDTTTRKQELNEVHYSLKMANALNQRKLELIENRILYKKFNKKDNREGYLDNLISLIQKEIDLLIENAYSYNL